MNGKKISHTPLPPTRPFCSALELVGRVAEADDDGLAAEGAPLDPLAHRERVVDRVEVDEEIVPGGCKGNSILI